MDAAADIADLKRRLAQAEAALRDQETVEAALRDSEEKCRAIFDSIDEGFCVVEVIGGEKGAPIDYRFVETNAAFERQTGLVDAVGRRMRDVEPRHEELWFERYARIARTRTPERFEDRADALGRWYDVYAFPTGRPEQRRVAILFRDVIDRKRAEQALVKSNALLRTTFDSSLQIVQLFKAVRNARNEIVDFEWLLTNKQWDDRWGPRAGKRLLEENPAVVESGIWDKFLKVIETGVPITHEHYYAHEKFDGWFVQTIARADDGILLSTLDITDSKRAERSLRDSEERQAFLLALGDAMRAESAADGKIAVAGRLLGEKLNATRVLYAEWDDEKGLATIFNGWLADGAQPFPPVLKLEDFEGDVLNDLLEGRVVRVDDVGRLGAESGYAAIANVGVRALLSAPLLVDGKLRFNVSIHQHEPRRWTDDDVALVQDVLERLWAEIVRARTETALAASEEKYRTIFDSVDEGFALIEVILDDEGKAVDLLHLETNPAYERHTGLRNVVGRRALEIAPDFDGTWLDFYGKVAGTGEAARTEYYVAAPVDRWFTLQASRVGGDSSRKIAVVFNDITERKRAEAVLRESEERQGFLLKLSDALRPLADPAEIERAASRLLVEHLGVHRAIYLEFEGTGEAGVAVIRGQYARGVPPFPERISYLDYAKGFAVSLLKAHQTIVVSDTATDPRLQDDVREVWLNTDVAAVVATSLVKDGRMVANFGLQSALAHEWTASEIRLVEEVADRTWAAVERSRAEAALRESEERQAFLLKLSDTLRAEPDADAMASLALRTLAERLQLDRCYIAEYRLDEDRGDIPYQVGNDRVPPLPTSIRLSDFPEALDIARGGTLVIDNIGEADFLSDVDKRNINGLGMGALVTSAARKGENFPVFTIVAVSATPRKWTGGEIALIEEVNERTWAALERAHAEAALRESEERFRQFGRASSDGLWIRDAATLALEYASDAMEVIYGISREEMATDPMAWPALIVPEDRDETFGYIEKVKAGESVVHEFRIQRPSDLQFRWIRSVGFPLLNNGNDITRIAGISSDITEEKQLAEHQSVLLAELQHRVRNIMAIIRSIVARTAKGAADTAEYVELLSGRLLTLARVQALLTRAANAGVGMVAIVHDELAAQATHSEQFDIAGPDVVLSPKAAETMTLAIHELTTNALKYGALSSAEGKVEVRWEIVEKQGTPWLRFDWIETGAPVADASSGSRRTGFGSELIEGRVPYELGGRGALTIEPGGARCHLEFPLKDGASVLETDAPKRATLFGGAIDMSGHADLTSQTVLVVEDDYYLATDTARALKGAGAEVIGPCATEAGARDELARTRPTCAVLDIDLRGSRSFDLARELKREKVPFVFITGYDQEVIPDDLADVKRLQKPVRFTEIVGALAQMLGVDHA